MPRESAELEWFSSSLIDVFTLLSVWEYVHRGQDRFIETAQHRFAFQFAIRKLILGIGSDPARIEEAKRILKELQEKRAKGEKIDWKTLIIAFSHTSGLELLLELVVVIVHWAGSVQGMPRHEDRVFTHLIPSHSFRLLKLDLFFYLANCFALVLDVIIILLFFFTIGLGHFFASIGARTRCEVLGGVAYHYLYHAFGWPLGRILPIDDATFSFLGFTLPNSLVLLNFFLCAQGQG